MPYTQRPPMSKRELVNRLLSNDFDGDFRHLGAGARVSRLSASSVEIRFDNIDRTFILSTHIPRDGGEEEFSSPMPTTRKTLHLKQ
jgi:hypothetical protein